MRELANLGISWWVDDFGTGYSSITHLRDLPISGLKLDLSFTAGITESDNQSARLAHGLVGLARGLGLATLAEGVETPEQERILISQGWNYGQGWLYGKAAPTLLQPDRHSTTSHLNWDPAHG
jgi:EAL domain-containing protein (putative c-di-GMP-specific phosphodiesterase class I)